MISEYTLLDMLGAIDRLSKCIAGDSNREYDVWRIQSRLQKELNDCYGYRYAYRCDMKPVADPRPKRFDDILTQESRPCWDSIVLDIPDLRQTDDPFRFYVQLLNGDCCINLHKFAYSPNDQKLYFDIVGGVVSQLDAVVCSGGILPNELARWFLEQKQPKLDSTCDVC